MLLRCARVPLLLRALLIELAPHRSEAHLTALVVLMLMPYGTAVGSAVRLQQIFPPHSPLPSQGTTSAPKTPPVVGSLPL